MRLTTKAWNQAAPVRRKNLDLSALGGSGGGFVSFGQMGRDMADDPAFLRKLRGSFPFFAAGVDIRRGQIAGARGQVRAIDPTKPFDQEALDILSTLLAMPDPRGNFPTFGACFGAAMEDALIVGQGPIHLLYDEQDVIARLRPLDGVRLRPNPKWSPLHPDADAVGPDGLPVLPRYWYVDARDASRGVPLADRDIMLIRPTPVTYQEESLAPMDYLYRFLRAEDETFKAMATVQRNMQPSGILKIPNARPGTVDKITAMWNERLRGKGGVGIVDIPPQAEFIKMGEINLEAQGAFKLYDIIVRGCAAALRISTTALGWTQTTLERSAAEQGEAQDDGKYDMLHLIQEIINLVLVPLVPNSDNLAWYFDELMIEEESESVASITSWTGGHLIIPTPDELRQKAGLDPIPRKKGSAIDRAYSDMWVATAQGPIPLFMVLGMAANQVVPGYDPDTGETTSPPTPPSLPGTPPAAQVTAQGQAAQPALPKPAQAALPAPAKGAMVVKQPGPLTDEEEDLLTAMDRLYADALEHLSRAAV